MRSPAGERKGRGRSHRHRRHHPDRRAGTEHYPARAVAARRRSHVRARGGDESGARASCVQPLSRPRAARGTRAGFSCASARSGAAGACAGGAEGGERAASLHHAGRVDGGGEAACDLGDERIASQAVRARGQPGVVRLGAPPAACVCSGAGRPGRRLCMSDQDVPSPRERGCVSGRGAGASRSGSSMHGGRARREARLVPYASDG